MKRLTRMWVLKAEDDIESARTLTGVAQPKRDVVCFLCQQSAEKYLKALLQDLGLAVPKTHELDYLLTLLLPQDGTLASLRQSVRSLTRYAIDFRYPGVRATTRDMQTALRQAERVRTELRTRLGLEEQEDA